YQDLTIPAGVTKITISFRLYIDDSGSATGYSDPGATPTLDFRTSSPNQQVRVDLMSTDQTVGLFDVDAGVLKNLFIPAPGQTATQLLTKTVDIKPSDLAGAPSAFPGSIRLRIAAANNQGKLIVGLDNVQVTAVFGDSINPTLTKVGLRNPGFVAGT